jgi:hypothetical protein
LLSCIMRSSFLPFVNAKAICGADADSTRSGQARARETALSSRLPIMRAFG